MLAAGCAGWLAGLLVALAALTAWLAVLPGLLAAPAGCAGWLAVLAVLAALAALAGDQRYVPTRSLNVFLGYIRKTRELSNGSRVRHPWMH